MCIFIAVAHQFSFIIEVPLVFACEGPLSHYNHEFGFDTVSIQK